MKRLCLALPLCASLAFGSACAAEPAIANIVDSHGDTIGTASFAPHNNGTLITVDVKLPEGTHAIHIHENGTCAAPDFKTAGGHYNPQGHKHGAHAGDLPNLFVESTGHIKAEIFSTQLQLTGKGALPHGAIIIHEKADDYATDPTGNAGARIACAVIKP